MITKVQKIKDFFFRPRNVVAGVSLITVLSFGLMVLVLFVSQSDLKKSQDIRQQASESTASVPKVEVDLRPSQASFAIDDRVQFDLLANTHNLETTGLQWVFDVVIDSPTTNATLSDMDVKIDAESGLSNNISIEPIRAPEGSANEINSYLVQIFAFAPPGHQFTNNALTKIAQISFGTTDVQQLTLKTNNSRSHSTLYGVIPPDDRLEAIEDWTIIFSSENSTVTPTNIPENTPTTIPNTPTPTPGRGGPQVVDCNEKCESHAECKVGYLCYTVGSEKRCRLSTNPTSASCNGDLGLNRSCNQYCADSRECTDGLTCWYNQCRLATNIESTTCTPLTTTQVADQDQLCNIPCSSSNDCAINLRCYQGACRLAVNPTSPSCSLPPINLPASQSSTPPKGAVIATPVVSPTNTDQKGNPNNNDFNTNKGSASDSGVVAQITPPKVTPTPIPPVAPNALSELINSLRETGRLLPVGVLVIGLILLLSSLLAGMFGSKSKGVIAPPQPAQQPPVQPTQQSQQTAQQSVQQTSGMTARLKDKGVKPPQSV